ncbi:MAG: hypothetical protein KAS64_04275 [Spirochaetes bacterium]|nr:hypothetical protein [Spirochaetota bacterium]
MIKIFLIGLILILIISGCSLFENDKTLGTVTWVNIEGGFYGIITDENKQIEPTNLNDELKVDGKRIRFRYEILNNAVSIYMWGEIAELHDVDAL